MSKFSKKTKATPAISTASLPDIVFMLLFFFMVTTKMRDTDMLVNISLPSASQLQKIENKSAVSYIYVGPPKQPAKFGKEPRIQVNDVFLVPTDIPQFISEERSKLREDQRDDLIVSMKVDRGAKVGLVTDVKLQLREADARQINYAAVGTKK
jgi:biopolymer transport protein ExbD